MAIGRLCEKARRKKKTYLDTGVEIEWTEYRGKKYRIVLLEDWWIDFEDGEAVSACQHIRMQGDPLRTVK